jgi:hypothetical protein
MKKALVLSLGLLLFAFQYSVAQYTATSSNKITLGVKLAPTVAWFDGSSTTYSADGADVKLNAGFVFLYNFTETTALETGIDINTFGGGLKNIISNVTERYNFSEVEIPIGIRLRTLPIDNISYVAQGGLGISYVMKAVNSTTSMDISNQTYPLRLSYHLGAGIEYNLKSVLLTGGINFNSGLTNIFNPNFYPDQEFKPSSMELCVGLLF